MARKAKKKTKTKSKTKKSKKARAKSAGRKSAKTRAAKSRSKSRGKPRKAKSKAARPRAASTKSARTEEDKIPASPSGRIGERRPSNQPKRPGRSEPRELAQSEPDARFGDQRAPENDAREDPAGTALSNRREERYKNTDEGI